MNTTKILGTSLIALSLLGIGCNPFADAQKKIENKIGQSIGEKILEGASGGKGDFEITDEGITIKDKDTGESVGFGAGVKIPAGFPTDIPRYKDSMVSIVSLSQDGKRAVLAVTVIGDEPSTISEWYDAELKKNGYERKTETNVTESLFGEYRKDGVKLIIAVVGQRSDDGKYGTNIQITREEVAK
ncbi:hypothetical protein M0Q28_03435 [Patescibacteria group bacterium]|jgi:hypothetical protein|nr:hypothetical protein [Patescibacteria group bacterium]